MIKKILSVMFLFVMLLNSTVVRAEGLKYAEIFDPKQEKVVKVVQLNPEIHNMVESFIKNVDNIYAKSEPLTDDGYAIKIPLDPAVNVQRQCLNALINEVYIIIPKNDTPFFMVFENEDKLLCFPFKGDINSLSKVLDFNLKGR